MVTKKERGLLLSCARNAIKSHPARRSLDMSEIASGTSSFASAKRKPAISEHAQNNTPLALASGCFDMKGVSPALKEKKGAFVSIHLNGELRGCIGLLLPVKPLCEAVAENAVNAAYGDARFPAIAKDELGKISVEISILTDPVMLGYFSGAHLLRKLNFEEGIVIKKGFSTATFLPQVWEQIPDKEDFLRHLCLKAGLEEDAWMESESEVYAYRVERFSD